MKDGISAEAENPRWALYRKYCGASGKVMKPSGFTAWMNQRWDAFGKVHGLTTGAYITTRSALVRSGAFSENDVDAAFDAYLTGWVKGWTRGTAR